MSTYPESAVNSKMDIQKIRRGRKQIAKERNEGIKAEKGKEGKEFNKNAIYPNVKEALIEYLTFETRLCNLKEERKKKRKKRKKKLGVHATCCSKESSFYETRVGKTGE